MSPLYYFFTTFLKFFVLSSLPLLLFYLYSPYPLPNIHLVMIVILSIRQFFYFNENQFRQEYENKARKGLTNSLGKTPAHKVIAKRLGMFITLRQVAFALNICFILIFTALYS